MYTYHIWIVLSESTEESDCGSLEKESADLQQLVQQSLNCKPANCIQNVNYSKVFQCSGSANHRGEDHNTLMTVLRHIARTLPGSYGLVYWRDDEDPGIDSFDGYRVIVMARGHLQDR